MSVARRHHVFRLGTVDGDPSTTHPSPCAAWRQINSALSGPLFRRIHSGRLTDRSIALIVKAAATRVGLDPADFGDHSMSHS